MLPFYACSVWDWGETILTAGYNYRTGHRRVAQIASLVVYNFPGLSFKYCPVPGLNCYACPLATGACAIGSLQHFMVIGRFPFLLTGFFLIVGAVAGRMVCGWICPIGWLQELFFRLPVRKLKVYNRWLPYSKYFVLLGLVLLIPYLTGEPWFSRICFVGTLQGGIPLSLTDPYVQSLIGTFFYIKLAITIFLLLLFFLIKRPFCRFICPLGAIYSLFNSISLVQMKVEEGCNECNSCQKVCPVDIKIYENPKSPECIRCLECTTCSMVQVELRWKSKKIKDVKLIGGA